MQITTIWLRWFFNQHGRAGWDERPDLFVGPDFNQAELDA